jgi:hypothetical protein
MRLFRSRPLKELEEALKAAIGERDEQAEEIERAEQAKADVDPTDVSAWEQVERDLAAARSEGERRERVLALAYTACGDEAERVARTAQEKAEADVERLTGLEAEQAQALARTREQREAAEITLDDARRATAEARVPYLPPGSPEASEARTRQRQRREQIRWFARHPHAVDAPRQLRDEIQTERDRLQREADEARARSLREAREQGMPERVEIITRVN